VATLATFAAFAAFAALAFAVVVTVRDAPGEVSHEATLDALKKQGNFSANGAEARCPRWHQRDLVRLARVASTASHALEHSTATRSAGADPRRLVAWRTSSQ